MPEAGKYKFYNEQMLHTGDVIVEANGKWKWAGHNGTRNSGTWADNPALHLTDFSTRQGVVARLRPGDQCDYDGTKPWFNTKLSNLGSLTK